MLDRQLNILDLPVEILELLFATLSDSDSAVLGSVCKLFYQLYIKLSPYWDLKLAQHYPSRPRHTPYAEFMRANIILSARLRYLRYLIVEQDFDKLSKQRVTISEIKDLISDYPELLNLTSDKIRRYILKEVYWLAHSNNFQEYGALQNGNSWDTDPYWAVVCQIPEELGDINFNPKKTRDGLSILQVALKYKVLPMITYILSLPISENYFGEGENGALKLALKINDDIATNVLSHQAFTSPDLLTDKALLIQGIKKNFIKFTDEFIRINPYAIYYKSDVTNNTLFHFAAEHQSPALLKALLVHDQELVLFVNAVGLTPLCIAAKNGNLAAVELLLPYQKNNSINCGSMSPLLCAIEKGNLRILSRLLEHPDINVVSSCEYRFDKENTLSLAARLRFPRLVEFLLQDKRFEDKDGFGFKALEHAFKNRDEELIKILLSSPKINKCNKYNVSILERLVFLQDIEAVKLLLSYDTSLINGRRGKFETPLYIALWRNQRSYPDVAMAELLLDVPGIDATKILIVYLKKLHIDSVLINKLLEHSANISFTDLTDDELKHYKFFTRPITLETLKPELDRLHLQLDDDNFKMKNLLIDTLYNEVKSHPEAIELLKQAYRHEIFNKPEKIFRQNFKEFLTDISSYRERLFKLIKILEGANKLAPAYHYNSPA